MVYLVLSTLYLFLPAYVANMCPVFTMRLNLPAGRPINEKLFGSHKTYRGFYSAFIGALIVVIIQTVLKSFGYLESYTLLDYSTIKIPLYAFVFGIGALTGDLIKSYLKRRLKIKPGAPFVPFDQIDFILGASLFLLPFYHLNIKNLLAALLITPVLHICTNIIGYALKLKKVWY